MGEVPHYGDGGSAWRMKSQAQSCGASTSNASWDLFPQEMEKVTQTTDSFQPKELLVSKL